ncbi:MAG: PhzF family phenazine biosynthesis protein [bacterium]
MQLKLYQIDAFTDKIFHGNPAAVCPLEKWLDDSVLLSIAQENNLSETAFYIQEQNRFHIRWFTPKAEVKLCGHATLATAYVLFNIPGYSKNRIEFNSQSGILGVDKEDEWLVLDFPAQYPAACKTPPEIIEAFQITPVECLKAEYYLIVFNQKKEVASANPDFEKLKKLENCEVIITAQSSQYDFVSRFFAPNLGIPEDPVTGSAHTHLAPYWSRKLGKKELTAKQLSSRGGELKCTLKDDRVLISGKAVKYMEATITI